MATENISDRTDVSPQQEPAPTPLLSAAEIPVSERPCYALDESRLYALDEVASRIAETAPGSPTDHLTGKVGEQVFANYVGIDGCVDTEIYADGGDGGVDLIYRGATVDVKTVGQHRPDPALTVDAYEPLRADYYVLASRIGPTDVRLVGYAPRSFVANAPIRDHDSDPYHIVDQRYLFPLPRL
ncbi:hypothetical protein [Halapricum hydrolyticum]|uniref:Uncharacterized protein n=1 Tax=Halapricum hydrolyticum TaxID=2979991 RepID=A0AAE3LGG9_9EURY|nr:hypothetical protein [Halapricum hydrolyticum]MCU4716801.1 hypothetical protein [Halapricum hydrolyticum]MCU4725594.1 hypothetical protein [Halapricum hydrolyticum]